MKPSGPMTGSRLSRPISSRSSRSKPAQWSIWACDTASTPSRSRWRGTRAERSPQSSRIVPGRCRASTRTPGSPVRPFSRRGCRVARMPVEVPRRRHRSPGPFCGPVSRPAPPPPARPGSPPGRSHARPGSPRHPPRVPAVVAPAAWLVAVDMQRAVHGPAAPPGRPDRAGGAWLGRRRRLRRGRHRIEGEAGGVQQRPPLGQAAGGEGGIQQRDQRRRVAAGAAPGWRSADHRPRPAGRAPRSRAGHCRASFSSASRNQRPHPAW